MRVSKQQLEEILTKALLAAGYELWGFELLNQGKQSLLRVYIDAPGGVTIDDCEKASRQLSAMLDVEEPMGTFYRLEVSSPGIDRPLFTLEQFRYYIGEMVKLRLHAPQNGRRNFIGIIEKVHDDKIIFSVDKDKFEFRFNDIDKAHLTF